MDVYYICLLYILADKVFEIIEEDRFGYINSDAFSSAQAETDTIFEEIELHDKHSDFSREGFVVYISGMASGHDRRDGSIAGRGLTLSFTVTLPVLIGQFGLSDLNVELSASPEDYGDVGSEEPESA